MSVRVQAAHLGAVAVVVHADLAKVLAHEEPALAICSPRSERSLECSVEQTVKSEGSDLALSQVARFTLQASCCTEQLIQAMMD